MRRGMTLIEVLLALALLGVLAGVGVSWITTSSRLATEQSERLHWQRGASALLQSIHTDSLTSDFNPARDSARATRRIQAQDGVLSIRTRFGGEEVRRVYRLDGSTGEIHAWTIGADARIPPSVPPDAATLLGGVSTFELVIDEDYTVLNVVVESTDGSVVRRAYRIGEIP